jgi:hypothetical protein
MRLFVLILISAGMMLWLSPANAQEVTIVDSTFLYTPDSVQFFQSISKKDPNRAALLSAVLPGLGQAYNGDYWKIPIIYSGIVVVGHFINYNNRWYNSFRTNLIAEVDQNPATINRFNEVAEGRFLESALTRNRDAFRRNRDFLMIWAGVLYMLNIAEAHIAAHLKEFQINDELALKFEPSIESTPLFSQAVGVSMSLKFK